MENAVDQDAEEKWWLVQTIAMISELSFRSRREERLGQ